MHIALHLDAGHDRNGNPKRLVMVLDEKGDIVFVGEEGYAGTSALLVKSGFGHAAMGPRLEITPKEYKTILQEWDDAEDEDDEDDDDDDEWEDEERHHRKPEPAMHPEEDE
jgi:hypothetical protein